MTLTLNAHVLTVLPHIKFNEQNADIHQLIKVKNIQFSLFVLVT